VKLKTQSCSVKANKVQRYFAHAHDPTPHPLPFAKTSEREIQ
jgi:hypothetical protein